MDKIDLRNAGANVQKPTLASPSNSPITRVKDKKTNSKRSGKKIVIWTLIVLLIAALAGGSIYLYTRYQNVKKENERLASNPQEAAKKEQENLIKAVGALTELPQGETPTIATVSDASKLKSQAFFANTQNGDKVLIYTNAKKAYLYRPSTNKIINIAPVNIGNGQNSSSENGQ